MLKPTFEISAVWVDHRLQIMNGKKGIQNGRLLPKEELAMIWQPVIMLNDINQYNRSKAYIFYSLEISTDISKILFRDVSSPQEVFVSLQSSAKPLPVDTSELTNNAIYMGKDTIFNLKTTIRFNLMCMVVGASIILCTCTV